MQQFSLGFFFFLQHTKQWFHAGCACMHVIISSDLLGSPFPSVDFPTLSSSVSFFLQRVSPSTFMPHWFHDLPLSFPSRTHIIPSWSLSILITHTHVHTQTHMHIHMYIHIHKHTHRYIYTHTHAHRHTHTYTHTCRYRFEADCGGIHLWSQNFVENLFSSYNFKSVFCTWEKMRHLCSGVSIVLLNILISDLSIFLTCTSSCLCNNSCLVSRALPHLLFWSHFIRIGTLLSMLGCTNHCPLFESFLQIVWTYMPSAAGQWWTYCTAHSMVTLGLLLALSSERWKHHCFALTGTPHNLSPSEA